MCRNLVELKYPCPEVFSVSNTASKNIRRPATDSSTAFHSFAILHPFPFSRVCCYSDRAEDDFFFLTLASSQRFSLQKLSRCYFRKYYRDEISGSLWSTYAEIQGWLFLWFLNVCVIVVHLSPHCLTQCMCCGWAHWLTDWGSCNEPAQTEVLS